MKTFTVDFTLFFILSAVLLFSCTPHAPDEEDLFSVTDEIENPYLMTASESIDATRRLLSRIYATNDRVSDFRLARADDSDYRVATREVRITISDASGTGKRFQRVPVHTIYFNPDEQMSGYAVTIADKRFKCPIVYFSECGSPEHAATAATGFPEDYILDYIDEVVNNTPVRESFLPSGDDVMLRGGESNVFFYHHLNLRYDWHQSGAPFTDFTPFRDGVRASAGCNAVAAGMIMAWHKWPLRGCYPRYEKDRNGIVKLNNRYPVYQSETWDLFHPGSYTDQVLPSDSRVSGHIADLLAEIGYKMNTDYVSDSEAVTYPDFACSVFPQMGYSCGAELEAFDAETIVHEIDSQRPVFATGLRRGGSGHSFVVSGVITRGMYAGQMPVDTLEPVYLYVVNGNAGKGNGWYAVSLFSSEPDTSRDEQATHFVYPYRYHCKMLTGIRPDYGNAGSSSVWRVSNTRPY